MTSDQRLTDCATLIDRFLERSIDQNAIDTIYSDFVKMYHDEMSIFLKEINTTKRSKKAVRWTKRPYWDEELSETWDQFHKAEKLYLRTGKHDRTYVTAKNDFLSKQKLFDKMLKRKRRSFQCSQVYDLEKANTSDPTAFWNHIASLGPKSSSKIPWEVYGTNNEILTDHDSVLNKWKYDFEGLFTPPADKTREQTLFYANIKQSNKAREDSLNDNEINVGLNVDFTIEEVRKMITRAKSGKAPGIDGLVADTFKNERSIALLTEVFNCCLNNDVIPTDWTGYHQPHTQIW